MIYYRKISLTHHKRNISESLESHGPIRNLIRLSKPLVFGLSTCLSARVMGVAARHDHIGLGLALS